MPAGTEFIRAIEHHRALTLAQRRPEPDALNERVLVSWIHHDNMIEGQLYEPGAIAAAMANADDTVERYLHPLLNQIRRYRDAIRFIWTRAHEEGGAVSLDNLKEIHRMLTPDPRDRGGLYRRTSPVHRAYYQRICPPDKVPYHLRKLFEYIDEQCEQSCDPAEFAAEVHHRLMFVYPFRRNPGTTARLFTNLLLVAKGYPPAIIPAHLRAEYYNTLCNADPTELAAIFRTAMSVFLEGRTPLTVVGSSAN